MAKADTKAPPKALDALSEQAAAPKAAPAPEPVAPPPKAKRFRLWDCGTLKHDGVTMQPGEELPFDETELQALGLMHLAVLIEG